MENREHSAEKDAGCDHPGLDHDEPFSYCWACPTCGVCKFIGHGPLCGDCYVTSVTPAAECSHVEVEGNCPSCAACAACRGECGVCPYVLPPGVGS